ncbi:TetR family transcriptional regulator [Streptomyces sp. A7024]|uniref:TetR family transcriptional regulator n=1 Tax=Streptomyces coryli TaxID=1128680 RepID=A0A6G4U067_9ACTN|nr:TetR family transcriptional regulator C-terminal domain-containing protein [Streptomyces coryli]NGN65625.1 TetR family transcriptional regulator [Streptomyces coryli]
MARTADHDARRRQIAAAVHQLVAEGGLDAATVARVAKEAGFSVGLVQHYFPSKDALLLQTCRQVMADVNARVADRIAEGITGKQPISTVVFASLKELLPLDEARRGEYRVTRAFRDRSLDNPDLAEVARTTAAELRAQLAQAVTNGKECGEVEPDADADLAATRITALTDGLADQLYADPARKVGRRKLASAAERLLRAALDEVFTGECRQYGR